MASLRYLPIAATPQQSPDFIVLAQERNEEILAPILKDEPEIAVAAALEKLVAQFTNTEAAMDMRLAKAINKITERQ